MWSNFFRNSNKSGLRGNNALRNLARKADSRLFDDIGLDRNSFVNDSEQMQGRYWRLP